MADSPFVFDVTAADFNTLVVENSRQVPVLVDFWADWCGPCKMQLPVLLKLVEAYQGKFLLAKINTDTERGLANQHKIRSIPTMKLFRDGQVVEEILGAQTETTLRTLLDKYVQRESDKLHQQAQARLAAGDVAGALAILREAAAGDPDNPRLQQACLQTALQAGLITEADEIVQAMPREIREGAEVRRLTALLDFARRCAGAPEQATLEQRISGNADDLEARDILAARLALAGNAEGALDQFLEILQRDRNYGNEAGRKGLLAIFELLGNQGPLVNRYRSRMFTILH